MAWGFVYVLSNDCMPGIYKIGFTERAPAERLEQLSSATSVPVEFDLVLFAQVKNPRALEKKLHDHFDMDRVNPGREFFNCSIREIMRVLEDSVDREQIFTGLNFPTIEWDEECADIDRRRQSVLDHFFEQSHDPIHWSQFRGFD
ncbi:GIY-YIG nuclease family protein [Paraburkholderia sp. BCC1885]|uniref:GIY-YIG nuclease family protein n=1 Tax=Paraburkholderia sp. BCC1885 TaxID=2562669 RepID=UPI0011842D6F|nr:GIY-YIG nuclease family protein [Paraburkholderia sp. BCC1885]